jgi:hypothetical protein
MGLRTVWGGLPSRCRLKIEIWESVPAKKVVGEEAGIRRE